MLKEYKVSEIADLVVHGRTTSDRQPIRLFWSASSLEMNLKAGELWVEFETDYDLYAQWISVVLNGAHIARFMLPKGRVWMPILNGLNPEKVNHVEIIRDVQAMPTDEKCSLLVHSVRTDGAFLPVPEKKLRLEVIGDSITSAEGAIGAKDETDWIAPFFCAARGYAYLTAQKLNADLHVISESGWGALSSWDADPNCAIPKHYMEICGTVPGETQQKLGALELNDFEKWNADVVVINLGANDHSAFFQPPHTDEKTGEVFEQKALPNGMFDPASMERLQKAQYDFLKTVRACHPNAYILWCHGMLGAPLQNTISAVVKQYVSDTGDKKAEYFPLPNEPRTGYGARSHPGLPMHEAAAEVLAEKIRTLL